ncbi:MAG: pseudaminic acid synthase [Gemmatimonadota bacterium]
MSAPTIQIGNRTIGVGHPVYIIAEMSANHNRSFDEAVRIVEAAKAAGADAIKLQTYTADTITIDSNAPEFQIEGTVWHGRTLHDLYAEASTPWEWQPRLKEVADHLGLDLFSSPFDSSAVDFLEAMGVPAFKIASFENVDIGLLRRVARTGKPVIVSTGMAELAEIDEAVRALRSASVNGVALLHCVSAYPAPADAMNLRTIADLSERFSAPAGLSDHTLGIAVPVTATALGACIIEKHLTLSRSVPGPDSTFSLEPDEFRAMVDGVRQAEQSLGSVAYGINAADEATRKLRRSLFVVEQVRAGETFTERNVRSIRPAAGLHTRYLDSVIGQKAARDIARGTPLSWDLVDRG